MIEDLNHIHILDQAISAFCPRILLKENGSTFKIKPQQITYKMSFQGYKAGSD